MESESGTNNTKISDSGYSNSCSNSNSQGSASSKSRHSGSNSSRSSGYGGAVKQVESVDSGHTQVTKRNKDRENKRKKLKAVAIPSVATSPQEFMRPAENSILCPPPSVQSTKGIESVPSPPTLELEPQNLETVIKAAEPLLTAMTPLEQSEKEVVTLEKEEIEKQPLWTEKSPTEKSFENDIEKDLPEPEFMPSSQLEGGFSCVISMYDGIVLYTTPSLTSVLGFPKEMWLGSSFIDFVHPKDRETFSNQITTSVALPLVDSEGKLKDIKNYVYVCLKRHRSLKTSGTGVVEKQVSYQAFHLTLTIKQIDDSPENRLYDHNNGLFLVIIAMPVYSAYTVPGERKKFNKFGMRHTATCIFSHVDPDVVTNFGFLPQDMLGKSVFDFYHPEDMPFLKEIYKSVMKTCQINGSVFRSKPYRFLVQNGCFAMIETEWSSVVNPWSRRLEFVISLHQVLQGPLNPDVFDTANDEELKNIPEEIIKKGKAMQAEIIQILTEEVPQPAEIAKQEVTKRCKDLANFMETLMTSVTTSKLHIDVPQDFNPTISERESVMLGEISPHHDFCDSKSSSETPPSYNQLNYNENIHRFFQSNPKTTVTTSDESNSASNVNMDVDGKNSNECGPSTNNQKCLSPIQNSGASGCGSAGNMSSESNPNLESGTTSGTNTSNESYKPHHLTESVLVRHNEDMEKQMIQKHRDERTHIKDAKKGHQNLEKYANKMLKSDVNEYTHGVKRSGSRSRDGDCHKIAKSGNHQSGNPFIETNNNNYTQKTINIQNVQNPPINIRKSEHVFQSEVNDINMWSPVSPVTNTPFATHMLPVYYIPALVQPLPISSPMEQQNLPRYQVQYLPAGVLCNYNPILLPQPVLCPQYSSSPINQDGRHFGRNLAVPKVNPGPSGSATPGPSGNSAMPPSDQHQFGNSVPRGLLPTLQFHRPASQATSVKAEPGSRMGSIASASVVNKALSECSRKDLGLQSVCSPDTPQVSPPDGETQAEQYKTNAKTNETTNRIQKPETSYRSNNRTDEESSCYSSSYSSFLKTDTGSGSNDDSTSNNTNNRQTHAILKQQRKTYPLRKKDPPWVESVSVSSDLIYRYQVAVRNIEDILESDLKSLREIDQPMMVNDQLHQLYIEMELEGLSKALTLEEGFSSSSSEEDNQANNDNTQSSTAQNTNHTEHNKPQPHTVFVY